MGDRPLLYLRSVTISQSLSLCESSHPSQGLMLSVSLAPRSWREPAFQHIDRASSSQGCLMSLRLPSSRGLDNVDTLVPHSSLRKLVTTSKKLLPTILDFLHWSL